MRGRAGRIAMVTGALLAALSAPSWAGSSQAPLSVGVVVPARCVVQMPATMVTGGETVAMRCTRGALSPGPGRTMAPGAVGPQITRTLLPAGRPVAAPRPLSEAASIPGAEAGGARMVITVNF